MNVTPEMINALRAVRGFARKEAGWAIRDAINTLDNAGVFAAIDEATGYDVDPEPAPVPNGLDPAEWGDMAIPFPSVTPGWSQAVEGVRKTYLARGLSTKEI